jgi:hypothetical protein
MKNYKAAIAAGVLALSALAVMPAQAATYLWTFTSDAENGSGTLYTTGGAATSGGGTVSGAFNDVLTLVANPNGTAQATSADGQWWYDNVVPPDTNGFLFTGASLGAAGFYNLWSNGSGLGPTSGTLGIGPGQLAQIGGTLTLTAVPEPATWAMMLIGLGFAGAAIRNSRRKQAAVATA